MESRRPLESFKTRGWLDPATAPAGMDYADRGRGRRLKFSFKTCRTSPNQAEPSIGFREDIFVRFQTSTLIFPTMRRDQN